MTRRRPYLRHSLTVFGALVLLVLALTVGYAALFPRGPGDVIKEAQQAFDRGEYRLAVSILDFNERSPSLQRDPAQRQALWRLRYRSHLLLNHPTAALRDLDRLMADLPTADETLQLDHIRALAQGGRGEEALLEARTFLEADGDHGPGLELAGEAGQRAYRDELRAVHAAIELDVGATVASTEARPALLTYLYRPDADDEVRLAIDTLRRIYADNSQTIAAWPDLSRRLQSLRKRIQEVLGYYQRSLEGDGEPVAAFRGLALSLEQSNRFDDLLILCESYRRRFDHRYVTEAGAIAAWAMIALGLDEAAIAATLRWYVPGTASELVAAGKLGGAAEDLMLAQIAAAWNRRDQATLQRARRDASELARAGVATWLPSNLANGLFHYLRADERCAGPLEQATDMALRTPTPHGQQDLIALIMPVRLDWLRRQVGRDSEIMDLLARWRRARPTTLEPWLALIDYQISLGQFAGATSTLDKASELQPTNESLLALRVLVARDLYRDSDQSGAGLLAQCLRRESLLPDVEHAVGYLLCAETALAMGTDAAPIALACARAATEAMSWSRSGRLLEIRAELLLGRAPEALNLTRKLVESMPVDTATLQLALAVFAAAATPATELLHTALPTVAVSDDVELLTALLHHARSQAPAIALPFARRVIAIDGAPAEARLLAAAAFARAEQEQAAESILRDLPEAALADTEHTPILAAAIADLLRRQRDEGLPDTELAARTRQLLTNYRIDIGAAAEQLLPLAADMEADHPITAWRLTSAVLAAASPEDRTGAGFAMAARLALRRGQLQLAEQHATAALAFTDGRSIVEALARLCFATERPERGLQVYRLVETPTDGALALLCGRTAEAEALTRKALLADPGDLLAHATAAAANVTTLPSLCAQLAPASAPERDTLLELASALRTPELCARVLPRAVRFAQDKPVPGARLLLARAHYSSGNAAEAAKIHAALFAEGVDSLPFWREVAAASANPRYQPAPILAAAFAAGAANGRFAPLPAAFASATLRTADLIEAGGQAPPGVAAQLRASVWQQLDLALLPPHLRPTLADVDALVSTSRPLDAWWVLDHLRPLLQGEERAACLERMLQIAEAAETLAPADQQAVHQALAALLDSELPYGRLIHLVLAHDTAAPATTIDQDRRLELVRGHLQLVASGRDSDTRLAASIEWLVTATSPGRALEVVEEVLRDHPAALALWGERARLMARLRRGPEGVHDLRRVLQHAVAPASRLAMITIAAEEYSLQLTDITQMAKLPTELRQSPSGRYAEGLIALRRGLPDQAIPLLDAPQTAGGAGRLLALTQAWLQSGQSDGVDQARATLEQLQTEYAGSPAARYAPNFLRQLTPR